MDIQTTSQIQNQQQQTATTSSSTSSSEEGARALTSDFETFLLMLTTQLENQDPLNPIESQDFAVQLATFSGVEQQVRTNDLLENLSGNLGATGLSQLAGWVGMDARVEAPVYFDGTPVDIALAPDPGSDSAQLIVLDSLGVEVARQEVPLGVDQIEWVGVGQSGRPLPEGTYSLQLASINQGEVTSTKPVSQYARILEARQGFDDIELVISGGSVVSSDSVTGLRAPEN
ncbi:MAG: flagellar hook capping FlgD N-terminal domain-containing protein [Pseudomonadota bacterium]